MRLSNLLVLSLIMCVTGVKLGAEPYRSDNREARLAKQRLLSMEPNSPGIRYRITDQLTKLVDIDTSIKNLAKSVDNFKTALSQVSGIIDVTGSNEGLVPQMRQAQAGLKSMEKRITRLFKETTGRIYNLYNQATSTPVQLRKSLQNSINDLVKKFNQQVQTQISVLTRQRNRTKRQAREDMKKLASSVGQIQNSQLLDIQKLLRKISTDKTSILTRSIGLNTKFSEALNIVQSAVAGVKDRSNKDLVKVQGIVDKNKQAVTDYINQKGDSWMNQFQKTVESAAKKSQKALTDMTSSLSSQFATAKVKAERDLDTVDKQIDTSMKTVQGQIDTTGRQFDLTIKNATSYIGRVVKDLQAPINDVREGIDSANALLSSIGQDATLSASSISNNVSSVSAALVNQFKAASRSIQGNPGFAALASAVTDAYNTAQSDIARSQANADSRVADLESNLGANDKSVADISAQLADLMSGQKKDFEINTQLTLSQVQDKVSGTSSSLQNAAADQAAKMDEIGADSDAALSDALGSIMSKINSAHDANQHVIDSVESKVGSAAQNAQNAISSSFANILSQSSDVANQASGLSNQARVTSDRIAGLSSAIDQENKQASSNLASATSQIGSIRSLGAAAVDQFYASASSSAGNAIDAFSTSANDAVIQFDSTLESKLGQLTSAQSHLTKTQQENDAKNAMLQSDLKANLGKAQDLLATIQSNTSLTNSGIGSIVNKLLYEFKAGSSGEIRTLKQSAQERIRLLTSNLKAAVESAGGSLSNQTQGMLANLVQLSDIVSGHISDLNSGISNASLAVKDLKVLVDKTSANIDTIQSGLKAFTMNSTRFIQGKIADTEDFLNETKAETGERIGETWGKLNGVMDSIDDSTRQKISGFQRAVDNSIVSSDSIISNFTDYINGMVEYEKKSAAARVAIQQSVLQSIIKNAMESDNGSNSSAATDALIARLRSVMGSASVAANSSAATLAAQKASQQALIDSFGLATASKVGGLLSALQANADGFTNSVRRSSNVTNQDSRSLLQGAGLGVQGIVDLAGQVAGDVESALNDTMAQRAQSQAALNALASQTNGLSNITEAQLAQILQAMMDSQAMYSDQLESDRKTNGDNVALISGVIRDFVTLVNETLAESNDLISNVDANYTDQSMALDSKLNTIVGFISREASAVSASADNSAQALKKVLTSNGPMEDGIRQRLTALSEQQDGFAQKVHDQLQGFISRLNEDSAKMNTARESATNRLYDVLHKASTEFAENAATWQAQRLQAVSPNV